MHKTYKYRKQNSILLPISDEYELTQEEYSYLYKFFVTFSMCKNDSFKKRSFTDYGWTNNSLKAGSPIHSALKAVIDLNNSTFKFQKDGILSFAAMNLPDGLQAEYDTERFLIAESDESSQYLMLFHRIRNCLSHGKFVLKYSSDNQKMIVFQDNDKDNVTARMILKLETVLSIINTIDNKSIL